MNKEIQAAQDKLRITSASLLRSYTTLGKYPARKDKLLPVIQKQEYEFSTALGAYHNLLG